MPNWLTAIFCFSLLFAVLFGPILTACALLPVPADNPFPSRREVLALVVAALLLPAASYITASSAYLFYITEPTLTISLSLFITAIAGRRPFLYAGMIGLLHLTGVLLWLPRTTGRAFDITDPNDGVQFLLIHALVVLVCGSISGLILSGVWRVKPKSR